MELLCSKIQEKWKAPKITQQGRIDIAEHGLLCILNWYLLLDLISTVMTIVLHILCSRHSMPLDGWNEQRNILKRRGYPKTPTTSNKQQLSKW